MTNTTHARVGLVHGNDRRRSIYRALELVRHDIVAKLRPQLLIKPNFLSSTNQLACSHVDGVRGIDGATALVFSADNRYLFVTGNAENAIAVFERDAAENRQRSRLRGVILHEVLNNKVGRRLDHRKNSSAGGTAADGAP